MTQIILFLAAVALFFYLIHHGWSIFLALVVSALLYWITGWILLGLWMLAMTLYRGREGE